jgi:hypothetical protein
VGSPKLFQQNRPFVKSDEEVSGEKPEWTEQENCLRLLEEAKTSEQSQSTDVHRVADDFVRPDGNELFWGIKKEPAALDLEQ